MPFFAFYFFLSTVIFALLGLVWDKSTLLNLGISLLFWFLALCGFAFALITLWGFHA